MYRAASRRRRGSSLHRYSVLSPARNLHAMRWGFARCLPLVHCKICMQQGNSHNSGCNYLRFNGTGQTLHPGPFCNFSAFIPEVSQPHCSAPALPRQSQHILFIEPMVPPGFGGCWRSRNSNSVISQDVPFAECRFCSYCAHEKHLPHFCHL